MLETVCRVSQAILIVAGLAMALGGGTVCAFFNFRAKDWKEESGLWVISIAVVSLLTGLSFIAGSVAWLLPAPIGHRVGLGLASIALGGIYVTILATRSKNYITGWELTIWLVMPILTVTGQLLPLVILSGH